MNKRYYWWGLTGVHHWTEQQPKKRSISNKPEAQRECCNSRRRIWKELQPLNQKRGASPKSRRPRESAATLGGASPRSSESFSPKALRLVNKYTHFYFGMYIYLNIFIFTRIHNVQSFWLHKKQRKVKNFETIKIFGQLKNVLTILSLKRFSRRGSRWCNTKAPRLEIGTSLVS